MKTRFLPPFRFLGVFLAILAFTGSAFPLRAADEPAVSATQSAISYYDATALKKADDYQKEQCKLDLVYPANRTGFATVVWFHGGGLTEGKRNFPAFNQPEMAFATVDYRLSPKVALPSFLDDAAASTAWVLRNISKFGGDPRKVFVAGHSAGGYLAAMIGMDPQWLAKQGLSNRQLAGIIPVSGQMTTHFHVKKLRGDTGEPLRPLIDEYAPLFHAAKDLPPVCLITGDRRVEFKCRVEENELLATTLRELGHPNVKFYEMGGLDHGGAERGAALLIPNYVKEISSQLETKPLAGGK